MSVRSRMIAAALVAGGCAIATGCGGSGSSQGASTNAGYARALKFSDCMRAHGVSQFPDPTSGGGGLSIKLGSGVNPQSPEFQSAQRACAKLQPGRPQVAHMSESQKIAALKFAQCMRKHGVPNFPDPGATNAGLSLAVQGMIFPAAAGIDPRSPAFKQATAACLVRRSG